jgi:hypothetical protein
MATTYLWYDGEGGNGWDHCYHVTEGPDGINVHVRKGVNPVELVHIHDATLAAALDYIVNDGFGGTTCARLAMELANQVPGTPCQAIVNTFNPAAKFQGLDAQGAKLLHRIAENRRAPPLPNGDQSVHGALLRHGRLSCMPTTGHRFDKTWFW